MVVSPRISLFAAALLPVAWVSAEPAATIAGHWEGAIHAPIEDVAVAVDLAADDSGTVHGTFSSPSQRLSGFPLWSASSDGQAVTLELKLADPGMRTFDGRLSADGQKITGQFLIDVHAVPFTLSRSGEARIATPPRSAALDAKLAGSWQGALAVGSQSLPLKVTLTNHGDRTATGEWAAGGAPATAIAIKYEGGTLTLTSSVTPTIFTGTVNAQGTELSGTLTEGGASRPVVFTRVASGS